MKLPADYPRRILFAVAGLSPQILTETVYYLAVKASPRFVPTEIHLLTTAEGREHARLTLLSKDPGWFQQLRHDYALPPIDFTLDNIHVLKDEHGRPLGDIRSVGDNSHAADHITAMIRTLTADPDAALHVSIAGGRKTMGFYAGYALSLYGRAQDRLSHVLVPPPYEGNRQFFYPRPYSDVIYTDDKPGRPLNTHEAEVALADIPFVRMRDGLPQQLLSGSASFSETVTGVQKLLTAPHIHIDLTAKQLTAGERPVPMKPSELAFYLWLVQRRRDGAPPVRWSDEGLAEEYLSHYGRVVGTASGDYERAADALKSGMTKEYFEQRKTRSNTAIKTALGAIAAQPYLITASGKRPLQRFGITLPAGQITIEPDHDTPPRQP